VKKRIGLWLGPIAFCLILLLPSPSGLSSGAHRAAAVAVLMIIWWVTEAAGMGLTSLLPLVLYPLFSILPVEETLKKYFDPNVFLFTGGFMLALALQKAGLHNRVAYFVIRRVGKGPRHMLGGFMLATAFISLWVSNTATALIMLPIGLAVIDGVSERRSESFSLALMLGIAYASSIGGVATLIGKPTNLIFIGEAKNLFPELPEVGFLEWSAWALPLSIGFLIITWLYLAFFVIRRGGPDETGSEGFLSEGSVLLGKWTTAETRVMIVFVMTMIAWIWPGKNIHDGVVAIAASALLFVIPDGKGKGGKLLDLEWVRRLPWDVILLFGGSFALAESFHRTGLASWIAGSLQALQGMPVILLVFLLCLTTSFLSELMSNTAQTAIMMPLLAAASGALEIHPYMLMIPATVASSLAFMMPIGTPPNAIVIASGRVKISQMMRTGFILNILGSVWVTFISFTLLKAFFNIRT